MNELRLEIFFANALQIIETPPFVDEGLQFVAVEFEGFKVKAEGGYVMYNLAVDKKVKMQVSYVDSHGNPAKVDGEVAWTTSDSAIATVEADGSDSSIVTVSPVGPTGQVQITAN